jgi:hypothetical protein
MVGVGDRALAAVAAAVPPLLEQVDGLLMFLEVLDPEARGDRLPLTLPMDVVAEGLGQSLDEYAEAQRELNSCIAAYRTGRKLKRLTGPKAEEWIAETSSSG